MPTSRSYLYLKISEDADITERIVTPAPKREAQVQQPNLPEKEFTKDLKLNEKYTFDNFVQGEGNKLAAGAALAVADSPGSFYNPYLFLVALV